MGRPNQVEREMLMSRRQELSRRVSARLREEQERRELQEIDAALHRIEAGHYGSCERCGATIGRSRLRAVPEARLCLDCSVGR